MKQIIYLILFSLTLLAPVNSAVAGETSTVIQKGTLRPIKKDGGVK